MKNNIALNLLKIYKFLPFKVKYRLSYLRHDFLDMFSTFFIETATACNRKCSYCPNSKFERGLLTNMKKMEKELFYKVVNELSDLKWTGLIQPYFYNEPLLDDRLPDLIEYTRAKLPTCFITIATNGDLLRIDLYDRLVKSGASEFVITQHQKEESETVCELKKHREKYGTGGVRVNYRKLEWITGRGGLVELSQEISRPKRCEIPLSGTGVNYNGDVIFCCEDYFNTIKLGNIKDEKLVDVWRKSNYRQLREEVRQGIFMSEICRRCLSGRNIC
jgi:radical SAM protein with 4Fe4S-binding SPASM domain